MDDTAFHQLADLLMQDIEQAVENLVTDTDIDIEITSAVMTLHFENGSKIIINRQEPLRQIWLATKTAGHHFRYQDKHWSCVRSGQTFWMLFSAAVSNQSGKQISFGFHNITN